MSKTDKIELISDERKTEPSSAFSDILQIREANGFSVALCGCVSLHVHYVIWSNESSTGRAYSVRAYHSLNVWHNTRSLAHAHDMARGRPIAVNVFKFSDLIPFCVTEKRTHPN